jgi:hypothetical protein
MLQDLAQTKRRQCQVLFPVPSALRSLASDPLIVLPRRVLIDRIGSHQLPVFLPLDGGHVWVFIESLAVRSRPHCRLLSRKLADVQNRPEGAITERNVPRTNSISDFLCIFCDANKHREIVARD